MELDPGAKAREWAAAQEPASMIPNPGLLDPTQGEALASAAAAAVEGFDCAVLGGAAETGPTPTRLLNCKLMNMMTNNTKRSFALEADCAGNRGWGRSPHPLFPAIFSLNCVSPN